jgi:hypothetical protein
MSTKELAALPNCLALADKVIGVARFDFIGSAKWLQHRHGTLSGSVQDLVTTGAAES